MRRLHPQSHDVIYAYFDLIDLLECIISTLSRLSAEWLVGFLNPISGSLRLSQLVLLHHQHKPTVQAGLITPISAHILLELGQPKVLPGFRGCDLTTAFMPMPEATVHKHSAMLRKNDLLAAWQILSA